MTLSVVTQFSVEYLPTLFFIFIEPNSFKIENLMSYF